MVNPKPDQLSEHAGFLKRLAQHLLRDEDRAEDAVQEAYVVALEQQLPATASLRGWLGGVVRNRARRRMRSDDRRRKHERTAAGNRAGTAPEQMQERLALQRRIAEAVQALPEPTRTAIVLRYLDGIPPRRIAADEGVSVRTIESRLRRGRETLRAMLDEETPGGRERWHALLLPLVGDLAPLGPLAGDSSSTLAGVSSTGAAAPSAAGALAAAAAVVTLGLGGYLLGGSMPPREKPEAAPLETELVDRPDAELSAPRPLLGVHRAVDPDLAALRAERDALRGRIDRLKARAAAGIDPRSPLMRRIAAADALRESTLPAVLPPGAVEGLDWGRLGEARALIGAAIATVMGNDEEAALEAIGRLGRFNEPLVDLVVSLAQARGKHPMRAGNWAFTEPAVQGRLIQAGLVYAELPLIAQQQKDLHALIVESTAAMKAAERDLADEIVLRRLIDAMERREAFFKAVRAILSPEQTELLSPEGTQGRVQTDLLSESLVYAGRFQPVPFREPKDLKEAMQRLFVRHYGADDPQVAEITREEIARWVDLYPVEMRDTLDDADAEEMGWHDLERVKTAHRQATALFERILGRVASDHPTVSKLRGETVFPLPERIE